MERNCLASTGPLLEVGDPFHKVVEAFDESQRGLVHTTCFGQRECGVGQQSDYPLDRLSRIELQLHRVDQSDESALAVEIEADDRPLDLLGHAVGASVDLIDAQDGTPRTRCGASRTAKFTAVAWVVSAGAVENRRDEASWMLLAEHLGEESEGVTALLLAGP